MQPDYIHLSAEQAPPDLDHRPFLAILIADEPVSEAWRKQIASWLIERNCLYFVAWGVDCELWHDVVDWAILEVHDFGDIPDDRFVTTTWHDQQPLSEVLWFAGHCASHPDVQLEKTVILHVAQRDERARILQIFQTAQETTET